VRSKHEKIPPREYLTHSSSGDKIGKVILCLWFLKFKHLKSNNYYNGYSNTTKRLLYTSTLLGLKSINSFTLLSSTVNAIIISIL
jgi:hypothetical protein